MEECVETQRSKNKQRNKLLYVRPNLATILAFFSCSQARELTRPRNVGTAALRLSKLNVLVGFFHIAELFIDGELWTGLLC